MENNRSWKLLSSEQLLKDKWIDVKSEIWEKPDGTIIKPFYKYGFPDYATALAITKDGKVILEVGGTKPELQVDIWSGNHPFYTGSQKIIDTEGRVEKFEKKYDFNEKLGKKKKE